MAVSIQQWLRYKGFNGNPFEFWEADRETSLRAYFVQAEWFDALRGDTQRPRSAVLFAPRGYGKSSHRLEIARLCSENWRYPALIVQLTEYDWLLADGLEGVTTRRYLQYVVRCAVQELWDMLQKDTARFNLFTQNVQHLLRLYGLMYWSSARDVFMLPPLTLSEESQQQLAQQFRVTSPTKPLSDALIDTMVLFYQNAQQADLLRDLVQLIQAANYASLYVLVDRVDENPLTEHNIDATLRLIQPLISNLHMIEFPGIAFKFFLPDHIHDEMLVKRVSRIEERVPTYSLQWSPEDLRKLLSRRLQYYSRLSELGDAAAVNAFQDLCEDIPDADVQLVAAARNSPRRLIMLAGKMIEAHCNQATSLESRISAATMADYLARNAIPLLYLDSAGFIWKDGKKQDVKLTKLPRQLLEILWHNRTRYVSKAELDQKLYTKGQGPDALYKLVIRLRSQLEPELKNSKNYIDFVEGHGFRLCNYDDEMP